MTLDSRDESLTRFVQQSRLPLPAMMQVRSLGEVVPGHRSSIKLQTFTFAGRFGFWMDAATAPADFDAATPEERAEGFFWIDENETDLGDDLGPYVWF